MSREESFETLNSKQFTQQTIDFSIPFDQFLAKYSAMLTLFTPYELRMLMMYCFFTKLARFLI